jgi:hypothetical protein
MGHKGHVLDLDASGLQVLEPKYNSILSDNGVDVKCPGKWHCVGWIIVDFPKALRSFETSRTTQCYILGHSTFRHLNDHNTT